MVPVLPRGENRESRVRVPWAEAAPPLGPGGPRSDAPAGLGLGRLGLRVKVPASQEGSLPATRNSALKLDLGGFHQTLDTWVTGALSNWKAHFNWNVVLNRFPNGSKGVQTDGCTAIQRIVGKKNCFLHQFGFRD